MSRVLAIVLAIGLIMSMTTGCSSDLKQLMEEKANESNVQSTEGNEAFEAAETEVIPEPSYGGTLRLATSNPDSYNPYENKNRDVDVMLSFIYEKLFVLDNSYAPVPVLVDSYTFDEDAKGVTLTLKNDAVFSDGSPLTADDVLYSYEAGKRLAGNIYSGNIQNIDRIIVADDSTVHVLFKQAYPFGLYDLSFPIIKENAEGDVPVIGTGPYRFGSDQGMTEVILERNEYWNGTKPYIDTLYFAVAGDAEVQKNMYDQDLIDVMNPSRFDWTKYSDDKANNIYEYPSLHYQFIAFSPESDIFASIDARRALGQAIDKEALASKLYLNHVIEAETPVPPNAWYNNMDKEAKIGYDPSAAAAYFETAVADTGIKLLIKNDSKTEEALAEYLKNLFSGMKIELTVEALEPDAYYEALITGSYDIAVAGWKMSASPDYTALFHSAYSGTATNFIGYANPEMDAALAAIYASISDDMLTVAIDNFQTLWMNELPYLSLFYLNGAVMVHDHVYGTLTPAATDTYNGFESLYLDNNR